MPLMNWPPSRGPKPPEIDVVEQSFEMPEPGRREFKFRQPKDSIAEQKVLVQAALDIKYRELGGKGDKKMRQQLRRMVGETIRRTRESVFDLDVHVATLATLSIKQAAMLIRGVGHRNAKFEGELPAKPLVVDITYPLTIGVRICVHPYVFTQKFGDGEEFSARGMDIGYFLLVVAQEYKRIYDHWRRYKVWGHELDDLYFDRLEIHKDGRRAAIEVTT